MHIEKKRIILITARADYGGGPEHVFRLLESLAGEYDFFIACPDDFPYFQKYSSLIGREKIIVIPHRKFTLSAFLRLLRFIRVKKIQLIHSHGKGGGIYSRLLSMFSRIECLHSFHGIHFSSNGFLSFIQKNIEKILSGFTKVFICVSESERRLAIQNRITKSSKIKVIPNGVNISRYKPSDVLLDDNVLKFISITRFDRAKNSSMIISIIKHLRKMNAGKSFRCLLVGDGPEKESIVKKASVEGLENEIFFIPFTPEPDKYFQESFCYISTSLREGLSLSVLEAMSAGVPCILSRVEGNIDLVTDGVNGFLFDINNPSEAAKCIFKLAGDKNLWKVFSEKSALLIKENFTVRIMAEKISKLYSELLREKYD
ncbi:MAG: glycosyltransferase [Ignavibacteriaceae bacterium]|nr:glycosyltransferase [Ignavibacteriaceae bacterium]